MPLTTCTMPLARRQEHCSFLYPPSSAFSGILCQFPRRIADNKLEIFTRLCYSHEAMKGEYIYSRCKHVAMNTEDFPQSPLARAGLKYLLPTALLPFWPASLQLYFLECSELFRPWSSHLQESQRDQGAFPSFQTKAHLFGPHFWFHSQED